MTRKARREKLKKQAVSASRMRGSAPRWATVSAFVAAAALAPAPASAHDATRLRHLPALNPYELRSTYRIEIPAGPASPFAIIDQQLRSRALADADDPGLSVAGAQTGDAPVMRFNIPAGALDRVLGDFTRATGVTVTVPSDAVFAITSSGVSGLFTPSQALDRLPRARA